MITIYGMTDSGNCYKPRLLMAMLGRPFRHVEVNSLSGVTREPAFLAKNRNGKVPLLELEDGRRIAESNAILLYLAEGTLYLPADAYDRALVNQWLFFEQYSHEPYVAVRRAILKYPERAWQKTPERLADTLSAGTRALGVVEHRLAESPFWPATRFRSPTSRSMPTRTTRTSGASSWETRPVPGSTGSAPRPATSRSTGSLPPPEKRRGSPASLAMVSLTSTWPVPGSGGYPPRREPPFHAHASRTLRADATASTSVTCRAAGSRRARDGNQAALLSPSLDRTGLERLRPMPQADDADMGTVRLPCKVTQV